MHDPCYHTEFKKPLKDLRSRHNGKWIEVLMLDKEVKGQFDPEWDEVRVVAKFVNTFSDEAWRFAVSMANMEVIYCGGVLIR